ncbi:hypothetical protein F7725_019815, partial [Dissostichus mawsoni]
MDALLTYGCEPGYTADGATTIFCTSSGDWTPQPPRCIRSSVCSPPTEPENGGYRCHPSPCPHLAQKTVIEYFCDEGYALKGDYKFLTCQNGEWDGPMQISCRLTQDKEPSSPLGIPTLSIVASTASSVALILLLVVLFVLVQPKLKSFHHSRREQGVSGQSSSIMVEGVQVTLPSYEEAVYGGGGPCGPLVPHLLRLPPRLLQSLGSPSCSLRVLRGPPGAPAGAAPTETLTYVSHPRPPHRPSPPGATQRRRWFIRPLLPPPLPHHHGLESTLGVPAPAPYLSVETQRAATSTVCSPSPLWTTSLT